MSALFHPAGTLASGDEAVALSPATAGWKRSGLRVLSLAVGAERTAELGADEAIVLPLSGGCTVTVDGRTWALDGRESVFAGASDFVFAGRGSTVTVAAPNTAAEVAVCTAVADADADAQYVAADRIAVEIRGAGQATRQVTNFGVPGEFDVPSRLMACEVITPGGNWSSYPAHKHDHTCEVDNEEIYYFRLAGRDGVTPSREGMAFHRTYESPGTPDAVDLTVEVRDGDLALVPRGYHGPTTAAPGYDLYYLNVLAGDGERSMAFCDDPAQHWIRDTWAGQDVDPRCVNGWGRTTR